MRIAYEQVSTKDHIIPLLAFMKQQGNGISHTEVAIAIWF